jgi:hypothetical protein
LAQLRINNESLWKENQQLKRAEEKAREDAAQTRPFYNMIWRIAKTLSSKRTRR